MSARDTRKQKRNQWQEIVDDCKDAIDSIHDLKSTKRQNDAASELIEYLHLYFPEAR